MTKKKKIIISLIVMILLITVGAGAFIGNYFYELAINPLTSKDMIFGDDDTEGEIEEDVNWLIKDSNYNDKYINSFDDLKLHGYEIKNKIKTNKWAIVVHGYTSKGETVSSKAKHFYEMGYNVLVPDLRAHGKSEGNYIGMGWYDRLDIIDWINSVLKDNPDSKIILHGTSMGAATVLSTSGEKLPSNVKAIIADCGYTSVWDEFTYQLKALFNLPSFPVMDLSNMVTMVKTGYSLKEASPIKQVAKSKTPILYIHGDKDDFVPYYMMDELYNATSSQKSKLTIKNAGHGKADLVNPSLYWNTVSDFLDKYISK
ncbi:alpha/beta hydrolase [Terrisporobacter mayombei]|uniref:2-succinyl-6-hydroxy-2, 4-cyclohexadiene-1-carboxylate synthase n=1 Tax=Terrisporobacter mayombei TaxID=1541 RepID=A0ABY9Q7Y8_9FIRM|nr:alpha/beta hydrolase [Terrisporobacter mayombei]MCC3869741.1 alpha/beta hydrolase [Terrisporobacter mayombei]WMT83319.1 2-succinyl-6-hydroxy-2,4-cyclohexadiene-1-carboxylate synthase [Terrisporobacter mayombei]